MVVVGLIMAFLLLFFTLAVAGNSDTARQVGVEAGLVISQILFFTFGGGVDDLLNAVKDWKSGVVMMVWLGNLALMTALVLTFTLWGHLEESDNVLSAAFVVAYASSTKYFSLCLSAKGQSARKVQIILGIFIVPTVLLGWIYIIGLTNPDLLPGWVHSSTLYATATAFGVSYVVDGLVRRETGVPMFQFQLTMALQGLFMVVVGLIGALLPSGTPLLVGLIAMESLPNLPGASALISEMKGRRQQGWIYWYNRVFAWVLGGLILFSAGAIWFQAYGILAGGITISLLQSVPWMQVGQWACLSWSRRPTRALGMFISALIAAAFVCVGLAFWITKGAYQEADLVAIWYSLARLPSAICLVTFGFLGVVLVGDRARRAWRYLLGASTAAIGVGFIWFTIALFDGSVGALTAPGLLMQVAGGVNVTVIYAAFNSLKGKANAAALATSHQPRQ
jgi:hypothetical protein